MSVVTQEHPHCEVLAILFAELDRELCQRYAKDQLESHPHNKLSDDSVAFVIWIDDQPVGCGAYKRFTDDADTVEIKRMYVRRQSRGHGVAMQLLSKIEQHASEHEFTRARLETGIAQPEAIRLYERAGYRRTENFFPYRGNTASLCMEKLLS